MDRLSTIKARLGTAPPDLRNALSRHGALRAGINLSNFLLVSSRGADGGPAGVSPDMAAALAHSLDLPLVPVAYASPGLVADAAERDEWDVALLGAEPQRAAAIDFTAPYSEIEATYLVPANSPLQEASQVDQPGRRIAVAARTAYGLWLERNIGQAELLTADGFDAATALFTAQNLDALAGLRPKLIEDVENLPGTRLLPGRFMAVQQALGVPKAAGAAIDYLQRFVRLAIETGYVAELIERHKVLGLSVAAPRDGLSG
ncbi:hypothetical protein ASE63_03440 [Bosea sp. Root381]|uniref:transporter substrate-binding domain-containing protein n=1 Tax=Bosea sp. Root381 TaxID=1736524 RepID=UPI0006F646AE|nr:transporter substrate-binding domain-containing protein [Bosea sp. Root381]KRE18230.1 hypothetical protein ASE63_03440 [Bosea sp. Root381]